MTTDAVLQEISLAMPQLELRRGEELSRHCSFRIGGPAAMALPKSEGELLRILEICRTLGERPLLLGRGTNMLFSDAGTSRLVIKPRGDLERMESLGGGRIEAGCAVGLATLACFARDNGLAGLEFAHGIPGSLGGAVIMNAGAYGGEMKDVVASVRYLDGASGELREIPASEAGFGYRKSRFGEGDVVLSAVLSLEPGGADEISRRMAELMEKRRASQPLDKPSAGSTFKRPATGYAAALIDECGLKGASVGAAQVSPRHAGFIVNNGGASFADVTQLMRMVQDTVLREKGVALEPEVRIIEG